MYVFVEGYSKNHRFENVKDLIPNFGDYVKITQDDKITLISKRDILNIEIQNEGDDHELVVVQE